MSTFLLIGSVALAAFIVIAMLCILAMERFTRAKEKEVIKPEDLMDRTPVACPYCGMVSIYIRTRYFEDGTADVWMCNHRGCRCYRLYFHVDYPRLKEAK